MEKSIRTLALAGLAAGLTLAGTARADEAAADSDKAVKAAPVAATSTDQTDAIEELRTSLANLTGQLNTLKAANEYLPQVHVLAVFEYAYERYDSVTLYTVKGGPQANNYAAPVQNGAPTGAAGFFVPTSEVELDGKINKWADWELKYTFAKNAIEDTGLKLHGISLLPGVDTGNWTWDLKVGDFRQAFGNEPQTGTSDLAFTQRALMFGGYNPLANTAAGTTYTANSAWPASKSFFVGQRVLGLFFTQAHDFGPAGYTAQFNLVNDTENEQTAGDTTLFNDAKGNGVDTDQSADNAFTEIGRFGINVNVIPGISTFKVGGSEIHNSNNTAPFAVGPAGQVYEDIQGADFTIESNVAHDKVWGEWVGANKFQDVSGYMGQLKNRAEGWYLSDSFQPLLFFWKDAPKVELLARYENINPNLVATANNPGYVASTEQAITTGIKWTYTGKDFTAINYTVYGIDGNFTSMAGTELLALSEQVYF